MPREQLAGDLTGAGFKHPEIVKRYHVPDYVPGNKGTLCVFEFCTEKPA
jgi:hypothetical protein